MKDQNRDYRSAKALTSMPKHCRTCPSPYRCLYNPKPQAFAQKYGSRLTPASRDGRRGVLRR